MLMERISTEPTEEGDFGDLSQVDITRHHASSSLPHFMEVNEANNYFCSHKEEY